jgi:septum formation protein
MALLKALRAARKVRRGLVLGVDTLVYHRERVLGKPDSARHAARMLSAIAGRWHTVYSGLALVARPSGRTWTDSAATRVRVRRLSAAEVVYWSRRNHDKAGAYAAQSARARFVERHRGDFDNVVGLPRRAVRRLLARARAAGFRAAAGGSRR